MKNPEALWIPYKSGVVFKCQPIGIITKNADKFVWAVFPVAFFGDIFP